MKTVLAIETTRPIGVRDLNGFIAGISERVPGCFVSQGPSTRGRVTVTILAPAAVPLEVAEQVLESLPELCDAISGIALQEAAPRRVRPDAPARSA
ncbi:hypothetical protein FHR75_002108 [Kineococcus radiotolerans]|uniref:Uncharacterized protein n=2 Tax=Kineococcus radiotolerans TaxID=131568 RepID=A6W414_KINRD|nr:hypothetical protein [Kineococcus radiotolerans]ABS01553.1 hypothetical protein Krad_0062 [Kineococcus radiotolerans SRS30216 = ATCC BAA-149]MBB2901320.1 hypothetical protein [Kineococcus radiotolerans]